MSYKYCHLELSKLSPHNPKNPDYQVKLDAQITSTKLQFKNITEQATKGFLQGINQVQCECAVSYPCLGIKPLYKNTTATPYGAAYIFGPGYKINNTHSYNLENIDNKVFDEEISCHSNYKIKYQNKIQDDCDEVLICTYGYDMPKYVETEAFDGMCAIWAREATSRIDKGKTFSTKHYYINSTQYTTETKTITKTLNTTVPLPSTIHHSILPNDQKHPIDRTVAVTKLVKVPPHNVTNTITTNVTEYVTQNVTETQTQTSTKIVSSPIFHSVYVERPITKYIDINITQSVPQPEPHIITKYEYKYFTVKKPCEITKNIITPTLSIPTVTQLSSVLP